MLYGFVSLFTPFMLAPPPLLPTQLFVSSDDIFMSLDDCGGLAGASYAKHLNQLEIDMCVIYLIRYYLKIIKDKNQIEKYKELFSLNIYESLQFIYLENCCQKKISIF